MQKIIIKHLKGSKTNQTEMFELPFTELVLGRDNAANIKFDPEKDDLVSRHHAKIIHDGGQFKLADLNSRNGTFVNGKRIQDPVILNIGDVVKLGETGVEFSFDMDPRPESTSKSTRYEQSTASQTREQPSSTRYDTQKESPAVKSSIGRNTVERLISETTQQTRKKIINVSAGILVIIILGASFLLYQSNKGQELLATALNQQKTESNKIIGELEQKLPTGLTATEIAEKYSNSTVSIENSWKLFDITSGEQLFHIYACIKLDRNKIPQLVRCKNENEAYPLYVITEDEVEPMLFTRGEIKNADVIYNSIGSAGQMGSGFVVTKEGFILTNRHLAAGWQTKYPLPLPGYILKNCPYSGCIFNNLVRFDSSDQNVESLSKWVPSNTKTRGGVPTKGKFLEGRNDFLDVTFPNTRIRIPASLVRASDIADVALIKIEIPEEVSPVFYDSSATVQAGDEVTITGYPANSPDVDVKVTSQDPMNRSNEWRILPVPTVSTGTIGKIISGNVRILGDAPSEYRSRFGDVYQLNVNTTGEGNSGGPVFNDAGHVIGIYTYGGEKNSFAVPIKYGEELMGIKAIK